MSSYAQGTSVTVERSIAELDAMLRKYGASGFAYGRDEPTRTTQVMFRLSNRMCRFRVVRPLASEYRTSAAGRYRDNASAESVAAAEERRRWRALLLVIKALLVAVEDGVLSLDEAFLPHMLLPGGVTFAERFGPQLDDVYLTGNVPALMPGGEA